MNNGLIDWDYHGYTTRDEVVMEDYYILLAEAMEQEVEEHEETIRFYGGISIGH